MYMAQPLLRDFLSLTTNKVFPGLTPDLPFPYSFIHLQVPPLAIACGPPIGWISLRLSVSEKIEKLRARDCLFL